MPSRIDCVRARTSLESRGILARKRAPPGRSGLLPWTFIISVTRFARASLKIADSINMRVFRYMFSIGSPTLPVPPLRRLMTPVKPGMPARWVLRKPALAEVTRQNGR